LFATGACAILSPVAEASNIVNIGVIGCGNLTRGVHLPTLAKLPGVRVAAVADADPRRLPAGMKGYTDHRQLLDRPDLHAVVIATSNASHAEIAIAAFQRGKHVYLEKPIAPSLPEANRVIEAWKQAGTIGMIGFNYRFNPLYAALQRDIGRVGDPVAVRSVFSVARRELPDWKKTRTTGGGVLLDLGSHHVDLVRFFFGQEIRAVSAAVRTVHTEADTATLELRLAGGVLIQSFFSWSAVEEDRFEIYGTTGKLAVNRYAGGVAYRLSKRFAPGRELSYRAALGAFVAAVRCRQPVQPDLADGFQALRVIIAAEESARTGKTVSHE
jgi:predicted dehydrogenase